MPIIFTLLAYPSVPPVETSNSYRVQEFSVLFTMWNASLEYAHWRGCIYIRCQSKLIEIWFVHALLSKQHKNEKFDFMLTWLIHNQLLIQLKGIFHHSYRISLKWWRLSVLFNALCFNTFNIFSIESRLGFCDGHPIVWILVWFSEFDVNFKECFKLLSYRKSLVHTFFRIFKRCPSNHLFSLFIQLNDLDSISLSKTPSPDNSATSMIYCGNADLMASSDLWNIWNQTVFFSVITQICQC